MKRVKLLGRHRRGCFALGAAQRGRWRHPWASFLARTEVHYHRTFLVFVCNDGECRAELRVEADLVCEAFDPTLNPDAEAAA